MHSLWTIIATILLTIWNGPNTLHDFLLRSVSAPMDAYMAAHLGVYMAAHPALYLVAWGLLALGILYLVLMVISERRRTGRWL